MTPKWSSACWATIALPLCLACKGDPAPRDCGDQDPTYLLTVRSAGEESLPNDTLVDVTYGGDNSESYSLDDPNQGHEVLFCTPEGEGAGGAGGAGGASPASGGPTILVCTLWIEGGATVQISGEGVEPLELSLAPESDDCGPLTVKEDVALGSEMPED